MEIKFSKYQGTGNDFVIINNLDGSYDSLSVSQVQLICNRRFGIGSDGLIRVNKRKDFDFEMDFFNPDGSKSFCGNGARCAVAYVSKLGLMKQNFRFLAIDGEHHASIHENLVSLQMGDVEAVSLHGEDFVISTGSPHYIHFSSPDEQLNVVDYGRSIRYSDEFFKNGINVNVVKVEGEQCIRVETYERGVENETYSCGTGVTASVLALAYKSGGFGKFDYKVLVKGGELEVSFERISDEYFKNIQLIGPAVAVFNGEINV